MDPRSTFTAGELADYAREYGDVPLFISSHGERYGIGALSWDPDEKGIWLLSMCPYDNPIAAVSIEYPAEGDEDGEDGVTDPVATARLRHHLADKLATHMEEVAAGIRAKYPEADTA